MILHRLLPLALIVPGIALAQVPTQPLPTETAPAAKPAPRPALWRVRDGDTTIFLFGTIHALPEGTDWLRGTVAGALQTSDTLATEVLSANLATPEFRALAGKLARNPEGVTLRGLMTAEQRERFEAGLRKSGLEPAAFDPLKPWFATNALVLAPLLKKGYAASTGTEQTIDRQAPARITRIGLETAEMQIAMFDSLPGDVQIANLLRVVDELHTVNDRADRTVEAWLAGDMATVSLESEGIDEDPRMAEALLYPRNAAWADWIARRLATPGRVFIAVGAGHLAGARSVQAALAEKGIEVTRLQ